jgi:starch-binding outer membrane protein, SusD/RagB family
MKIRILNKKITTVIALAVTLTVFQGCSDFLDYTPQGVVPPDLITTPAQIDQLCTAAYATLIGGASNSWFQYGSLRSDESYKGGGGLADVAGRHSLEVFNLVLTNDGTANGAWVSCYNALARINVALRMLDGMTEAQMPTLTSRKAEMMFLSGHYYFLLKILFKYPVYLEYTTPVEETPAVSNDVYTNDQLWDKIAAQFQYAIDNLPATQTQKARPNKYTAAAYLARVRLYQAYQQDEQNNVTSINAAKLNDVVTLCDQVIGSGKYELNDDFAKNFMSAFDNSKESVFAVQYSINDGSNDGRLSGASLNYPHGAPQYGCCGFHQPSQTYVNAMKTGADGLPLFDTYNATEMKDSIDFWTNTVDPRLDHTVGIPTHPFKYSPTFICKSSWARVPSVYGYFNPMKDIDLFSNPSYKKIGAFMYTSKNFDWIRYDDVLLMKAEALIQLNREDEALPLINQIRTRAANSTSRIRYANNNPASNYLINTYQDGVNCDWTKDYAIKALQFERLLEFGQEGWRLFDLVRWGIASQTINGFFLIEKTRHSFLASAAFTDGRDEFFPIPQAQIDLVEGLYRQNNGWAGK